ncbi:MAG TPA: hemolysin family protein [Saprospiraceae bacterium]|nr:hemolysin family protein [Saprospiraceae bacterium]
MTVFLILFFLLLTAFFAGSEIAFFTANKLAVEIKKSRGSKSGKILSEFFDNPDHFISVMLVGINISLVILSYLLTDFFASSLSQLNLSEASALFVNTLIVTFIILIFGEFIPKAVFRLHANTLLMTLAYPLYFFYKLLLWPAKLLSGTSNFIIKNILKVSVEKSRPRFTNLDLEHYIQGEAKISEEVIDADIFKNALQLKQTKVKSCMVPRREIIAIDVKDSIQDLRNKFSESSLSKIVVIDDDIDNVLGYIHHQQMFKEAKTIKSIVMDMPFVPETLNVYDLMLRMNKLRISVACVVDEFGGTAGIITLEDILEEIFGEIEDEHDKEEYVEQKISETEFIFSGRLELHYLNQEYGFDFPEGEYTTLSGYLVMSSGVIPQQGAELLLEDCRFILEQVSDTRIELVKIIKLDGNN